jgi:hypothetical protein
MAFAGCLVAIGLATVLIVLDQPLEGNAATVSATFLSYSNDPSGVRLAVFRISNHSQIPIRREKYYEVHIQSGSGWTNQPTVFLPSNAARPVVRPNQNEIFCIKAPVAGTCWRLCYPYEEHEGWIRRVRRDLGLPSKHVRPSYAGFTDAIER